MWRSALAIALFSTAVAAAGNICTDASISQLADRRSTLPAAAAMRADWHAWQTALAPMIGSRKLGQVMWTGSHDAGTCAYDGVDGYAAATRTAVAPSTSVSAITQKYSVLDQLCMGARFFDLRISSRKGGVFRIIHPLVKSHYFESWDSVLHQIDAFAADHPKELLFPRLKFVGATAAEKLQQLTAIRTRLGAKLITHAEVQALRRAEGLPEARTDEQLANELSLLSWNGLLSAGQIVFLIYPTVKPTRNTPAGTEQWRGPVSRSIGITDTTTDGDFWPYRAVQSGDYSDSYAMAKVYEGQKRKRAGWLKAKSRADHPDRRVHGMWYTATEGWLRGSADVKVNTRELWVATAGVLPIVQYHRDFCPIGNLIITDFVGEDTEFHWRAVMTTAKVYNTNGHCETNGAILTGAPTSAAPAAAEPGVEADPATGAVATPPPASDLHFAFESENSPDDAPPAPEFRQLFRNRLKRARLNKPLQPEEVDS